MITQPFCFLRNPANLQHRTETQYNIYQCEMPLPRNDAVFQTAGDFNTRRGGLGSYYGSRHRSLTSFVATFRFNSIVCTSG